MVKFLHAADFHLDSPFAALNARQAAARRRESRELPLRMANYVNAHEIPLVLLAGDLFDGDAPYAETIRALADALGQMNAQVFISPGNHDRFTETSPYRTAEWPENVHIFKESAMTAADVPELGVRVYGAAFTAQEQNESLLAGFTAPQDGISIGLLHGELDTPDSRYDPLTRAEVAASGLTYLALGHIHKRQEPIRCGGTLCAWPGCPEGRGFDELGEKGFYEGEIADGGKVTLTFVPFARRRYEILEVDVTGREPRAAAEAALPAETAAHLYRILLTGETDERGADAAAIREALCDRFYALDVRDCTRMAQPVWDRAGEDSLRGLFLAELKKKLDAARTDEEREQITRAARFGLAALDHRDLG